MSIFERFFSNRERTYFFNFSKFCSVPRTGPRQNPFWYGFWYVQRTVPGLTPDQIPYQVPYRTKSGTKIRYTYRTRKSRTENSYHVPAFVLVLIFGTVRPSIPMTVNDQIIQPDYDFKFSVARQELIEEDENEVPIESNPNQTKPKKSKKKGKKGKKGKKARQG